MAKYYLYLLLSFFIFLNGVEYFNIEIKNSIKKQELLKYKLKKQLLYDAKKEEVQAIVYREQDIISKNKKLFFDKKKKETIVFSEIQEEIQATMKKIGGKITRLNSGIAIDTDFYKKYPIAVNLELIPEDLDDFFKRISKTKRYLFLDMIHISKDVRKNMLRLNFTIIGYQLK